MGTLTSFGAVEIQSQWHTENHVARSLWELPVGGKVFSDQTTIAFWINGLGYALQFGPQPLGLCDGPAAAYGDGTTRATIHRVSTRRFEVDLPVGSVGRLFTGTTNANVINKGLYYMSIHYSVEVH